MIVGDYVEGGGESAVFNRNAREPFRCIVWLEVKLIVLAAVIWPSELLRRFDRFCWTLLRIAHERLRARQLRVHITVLGHTWNGIKEDGCDEHENYGNSCGWKLQPSTNMTCVFMHGYMWNRYIWVAWDCSSWLVPSPPSRTMYFFRREVARDLPRILSAVFKWKVVPPKQSKFEVPS